MDFEHSKKVKDLLVRLENFMDKYVYPIEKEYEDHYKKTDNLWKSPPLMRDLKEEAKKAELWNLFLPESKRGLPTPWVAFYKIFGLARIFPKSKKFGKYHLTYLDKDKTHEIDVLSGAFMLMRKETLDKCGLLDETFFM